MIDEEEACCDNCEEGIEPCCDEELKVEIEEVIAEQIVTEGITSDIDDLAKHLCCQNKFYIIYKAMNGLNKAGLTELRDHLRSYVKTGSLHPQLESKFRHAIDKAD